ncbi:MAG: hypothetical protein WC071_02885 [Victivallaceae bacterium]
MIRLKFSGKILLTAIATFTLSSAFAGSWNWTAPYKGPDKNIETLIITGNYKKPLMLAQIIQSQTKQPYILVPAKDDTHIFFCPVSNKKPALEIKEENLAKFISFINPQRVVVFGDTSYVPRKYIDMVDRKIPLVIISGDDWNQAAATSGDLLNLTNLPSDYSRLNKKLESGRLYKPTPKPKQVEEVVASETVEVTETEIPAQTTKPAVPEASDPALGKVTAVPEVLVQEPEIAIQKPAPVLVKDKK